MLKIYLIRHGESIANTKGIYQGQTYDTELSELGEKQIALLKKRFSNHSLDGIFASPLKRTRKTASVLGDPIFIDEILETNHGDWEGKTLTKIKELWPQEYLLWKNDPEKVDFPNGESFRQTFARSVNWFLQNFENKTGEYAVVTHSNIIGCLLCHFLNLPLSKIWDFAIEPTSVTTLVKDQNGWKVEKVCDSEHISVLLSNLSSHAI